MWMVALYLRECRKTERVNGYKLDIKISREPAMRMHARGSEPSRALYTRKGYPCLGILSCIIKARDGTPTGGSAAFQAGLHLECPTGAFSRCFASRVCRSSPIS